MSGKFRQALLIIGLLGFATAVVYGASRLNQSDDLYYAAALAIEKDFSEYVDITYIGRIETEDGSNPLIVVVISKKIFKSAEDPAFVAFDKKLTEELRKLITDEVEVDLFIHDPDFTEGYAVGFDAQGIKNGATLDESVMASTPVSGSPKPEYLIWMDK